MVSLAVIGASSAALFGVFCVVSNLWYRISKKSFPGPSIATPIIGAVVPMVKDPTKFWDDQIGYNPNGLSFNSLAGKFLLFCTNTEIAQKVFKSQIFTLYVHPAAMWLMHDNFIHLNGNEHSEFRKPLLPAVYGREALNSYLESQEDVMRQHLSETIENKEDLDIRINLQRMNAQVSQTSLIGPYLTKEQEELLSQNLLDYTMGWLGVPFPFPGNACWRAWRAMDASHKALEGIVDRAKDRMLSHNNTESEPLPECALDVWLQQQGRGKKVLDTKDIAITIHDFLFASQDATTAALVWATCLVVEQPEVMEKVRLEVAEHTNDHSKPIWQVYEDLEYLHAVVVECLTKRPPVPMVPHMASQDVTLDDGTFVKKGTVVIPSIIGCAASNDKEWSDKSVFRPEKNEDRDFLKTLVFGAGQHKCPGRKIAQQVIGLYIAILACDYEVERHVTPDDNKIQYLPTLYPLQARFTIKRRA